MSDVHAVSDANDPAPAAASPASPWASVAADVRTDPQFSKKIADLKSLIKMAITM